MSVKALRATFEDVLANQEKLREWLDRLVQENRPLRPEERGPFMQLVARAMLGQGSAVLVSKDVHGPMPITFEGGELSGEIALETAEEFIRFLAYWDADYSIKGGRKVPICEEWKVARQLALKTFPLALAQAAQISPERVPYRGTEAKRV